MRISMAPIIAIGSGLSMGPNPLPCNDRPQRAELYSCKRSRHTRPQRIRRRTAMRSSAWLPVPGVDPSTLRDARLEAHYAVQSLARTARAFIAPRPDDSHTNLGWDDSLGGFTTHRLPDGSRLGLILAGLKLVWLDG